MKKLKLIIEGIHCASCAGNVERTLKSITGVKSVSVNVLTKKAILEAENSVSEEELKKTVSKAGFKIIEIMEQ